MRRDAADVHLSLLTRTAARSFVRTFLVDSQSAKPV